jgi:hypothetical protein
MTAPPGRVAYLVVSPRLPDHVARLGRVLRAGSPAAPVVVHHDPSGEPLHAGARRSPAGCSSPASSPSWRRSRATCSASPVWGPAWDYAYNATQFFAAAACWLAAAHSSPRERRAWIALSLGLTGFFCAEAYYSAFLSSMESPPFPSPADAMYLSTSPAPTPRSCCSCARAPAGCRSARGSTA